MHESDLAKPQQRARHEALVIRQTEEGYRVYAPRNPANAYMVTGTAEDPACSCPDFQHHESDPGWRCKHILAVFAEAFAALETGNGADDVSGDQPSTSVTQLTPDANGDGHRPNGTRHMVLKRSVSPDGRIDSLSIELRYPCGGTPKEQVRRQAQNALALQKAIVEDFLGRQGGNGGRAQEASHAQLLNVGGMETRWGRRFFLTFQVNGQRLRLFGSPRHLAEAITAAGYPEMADGAVEGAQFNVPCRVTTKPSADGRYTNVDRVFPANGAPGHGRLRS